MKIDLQIHSTYSDGRNTPEEIISLSKERGVNVISITDHDSVLHQEHVRTLCNKEQLRYIPGVEISTKWQGETIHILGYNFATQDPALNNFLSEIVKYRKESIAGQFDVLNKNLNLSGKGLADEAKYRSGEIALFSIPGLIRFLKEEGITQDFDEGFKYTRGIKDTVPDIHPRLAIDAIKKAGGKAVVSHPFAPRISLKVISEEREGQERLVSELAGLGLDGLEVFSSGHSEEDKQFALEMCKRYSLFYTAGSDWHGPTSLIGEGIRAFLPYYLNDFGLLEVSTEAMQEILNSLECNL